MKIKVLYKVIHRYTMAWLTTSHTLRIDLTHGLLVAILDHGKVNA